MTAAVTGVGIIGPLGCTAPAFLRAWETGQSAPRIRIPDLARTPLEDQTVGALPAFDAGERLGGRRMLKYMSEAAVLGCIAAREALQQANAARRFAPDRIGLYAGTGLAAAKVADIQATLERSLDETGRFSCRRFGEDGLAATNPLLSFKILANMPACLVSIMEGIQGPNLIFTPWEGQTAGALLEGWRAVADGEVDCALVGAADTPAYPASFAYLRQTGCLRAHEYPSSAAAYLVLERPGSAERDGVPILSRLTDMNIAPSPDIEDPLAVRIGRTFAAAPALLMALSALAGAASLAICGVDGQRLTARLDGPS